jgi:signal transduction histidine kinase
VVEDGALGTLLRGVDPATEIELRAPVRERIITARLRDNRFDLEGDRALVAVVDRDRAKRALTNILDNALRYSPPGTPIRLRSATGDSSTVQITIHDRGPGIDPSLLPHIFEPGVRGAPATDGNDGGAGLGLTIAKRLLEHQHATLTVQNDPAGGVRIRITLRRAPSPTDRADAAPAAEAT